MGYRFSTTPRLLRGLIVFGSGAILLINGLLASDLYHQRRTTITDASQSTDIIATGLQQYTARSLETVDTVLESIATRVGEAHGEITLQHERIGRILEEAFRGPTVDNYLLLNAQGRWVNDALGNADPEISFADRSLYRTHQLMPDAGLFVGESGESSSDNKAGPIMASRIVQDGQGNFLGVIVARLQPDHYRQLFTRVSGNLPADIALLSDTGQAFAIAGSLPDDLFDSSNAPALDTPPARLSTPGSEHQHLVSLRSIGPYPLVLAVATDVSQVLAPWRQALKGHVVLGLAITLLLGFGIRRLWRELRRNEQVQQQLHESEARFRSLIESTSDFVWEMDADGYCVYASPQVKDMMGYTPEEVVGMRPYDPMTPREQDRLTDIYHAIIESREPFHLLENRNVHKDGHEVVLETSGVPIFDEEGRFLGYRGIDRDITERKRLEEALHSLALLTGSEKESEFFQLMVRHLSRALGMQQAILVQVLETGSAQLRAIHDDGGFRENLPVPTEVIDRLDRDNRIIIREDAARQIPDDPFIQRVDARSLFATTIRRASGTLWGWLIATDPKDLSRVRASRVEPILDVFAARIALELDRNQAQADLSWEASHDTLTGLLNRRAFDEQMRRILAQPPEPGRVHALIYMDLDQFKVVNDTCGHMAGDELLKQLSGTMQHRLRRTDLLARLGGDEFGLILGNCPIDRTMDIAETLMETVREFQFRWEGRSFSVGASIGMTHTREAAADRNDMLAQSDLACYAAKELGRNRIQVYQRENAHIQARHGEMGWVPRLDRALADDRFELHGQWIMPVDPDNGPAPSVEVLLRLRGEDGSMVSPGEFIPAAERYNLMSRIDRHVIDRVMSVAATTPSGKRPRRWSINLSGTSLDDGALAEFIESRFRAHAVDPAWFCFEITETAAIRNFGQAQALFSRLRELGCRVGLDDFGSGLSSFAYLREIKVDALKIDGSFVRHIVRDEIARSMVRAMHEVGKAMSLTTVAEFVEDRQIIPVLREMGVDLAQGFALHHPQPLDAMDPPSRRGND